MERKKPRQKHCCVLNTWPKVQSQHFSHSAKLLCKPNEDDKHDPLPFGTAQLHCATAPSSCQPPAPHGTSRLLNIPKMWHRGGTLWPAFSGRSFAVCLWPSPKAPTLAALPISKMSPADSHLQEPV